MNAGVIDVAKKHNTPVFHFDRELFADSKFILDNLSEFQTDLIVLAGFLWKIPDYLIKAYPDQIINLHPSLLPKFGGKGMYGHHVHEAVKANKEKESGMTIHFVNEKFDEGDHIFYAKCALEEGDSAEEIARKVLVLEHEHYARVIDELL